MTTVPATPALQAVALECAAFLLARETEHGLPSTVLFAVSPTRDLYTAAYDAFTTSTGWDLDIYHGSHGPLLTARRLNEVAKEISA